MPRRNHAALGSGPLIACALGTLLLGCSEQVPGDSNGPDAGSAEVSLCTAERDPSGMFCMQKGLTSLQALKVAKAETRDEVLFRVRSSGIGVLNVDGEDLDWTFSFVDREADEILTVRVDTKGVHSLERAPNSPHCGAANLIHALDSRQIVHDAIRRLEKRLGVFTEGRGGNLFFGQDGCTEGVLPEDHHVQMQTQPTAEDAGGEQDAGDLRGASRAKEYFVRYWDDGRFIELVGPCEFGDTSSCLDGPEDWN